MRKISLFLVLSVIYQCNSGLLEGILSRSHGAIHDIAGSVLGNLGLGHRERGPQYQNNGHGNPETVVVIIKENGQPPGFGKPHHHQQHHHPGSGHHSHEGHHQYQNNENNFRPGQGDYRPSYDPQREHGHHPHIRPGYNNQHFLEPRPPPEFEKERLHQGSHRPNYGSNRPSYAENHQNFQNSEEHFGPQSGQENRPYLHKGYENNKGSISDVDQFRPHVMGHKHDSGTFSPHHSSDKSNNGGNEPFPVICKPGDYDCELGLAAAHDLDHGFPSHFSQERPLANEAEQSHHTNAQPNKRPVYVNVQLHPTLQLQPSSNERHVIDGIQQSDTAVIVESKHESIIPNFGINKPKHESIQSNLGINKPYFGSVGIKPNVELNEPNGVGVKPNIEFNKPNNVNIQPNNGANGCINKPNHVRVKPNAEYNEPNNINVQSSSGTNICVNKPNDVGVGSNIESNEPNNVGTKPNNDANFGSNKPNYNGFESDNGANIGAHNSNYGGNKPSSGTEHGNHESNSESNKSGHGENETDHGVNKGSSQNVERDQSNQGGQQYNNHGKPASSAHSNGEQTPFVNQPVPSSNNPIKSSVSSESDKDEPLFVPLNPNDDHDNVGTSMDPKREINEQSKPDDDEYSIDVRFGD